MDWSMTVKRMRWMIAATASVTVLSCLLLWNTNLYNWKTRGGGRKLAKLTGRLRPVLNVTEDESVYNATEIGKAAGCNDKKALEEELSKRLKNATTKKTILLWDSTGMQGPVRSINTEACGNCELTKNRSQIDDVSTAAVVFYYKEISSKTMPPISRRNPDQLYVFWTKEPTPLMRYVHRKELEFEDSYGFNATMTYRRDSDFLNKYRYHWIRASFNSKLKPEDLLKLKTKTSVTVISDCNWTAGARLRYRLLLKIKALGFDLDGFGKCFPEGGELPRDEKELIKKVRGYKFFFAFENSYHCTDYITEKFYRNSLFAGAVPIVLGPIKEQYEAVAPPGSFIFLEDFSTLDELIEYLRYLDRNDTAYLQYSRWRLTSEEESSPYSERRETFCHLCRSLHGINIDDTYKPNYRRGQSDIPVFTNGTARRVVSSLRQYLFVNEDKMCMERNETLLPIYAKYGLFDL